ncbi:hypothetical protein CC80DRAFT_556529 [Byssothecium circinans]|uniref:Uncharacterized protein n=1 Tax=Byssothecium circinans TaxID=147558 RepID=A0A6A5T6G6_9PLEO|nr:hypothetical protein CC80DRAFT_556560 [Byssothecium circinans]KAF1948233.1 hypothetical protein CC80DRAFT_556529 [Byssothecium circinans]
MATNDPPIQPVQDQNNMEEVEVRNEDIVSTTEEEKIPPQKSGVRINPNALMQTGKYEKGDIVHMAIVERGVRTKGTFTVARARYNSSGDFHEYQLTDDKKKGTGVWVREKALKLQEKAKR